MTKIIKNGISNSTGLTSNISKSKNKEQLKNTSKDNLISKIEKAIKQLKIVSNDIKKSPPVNKLDMTKKISDPSNNRNNNVPKPLPKPPSKNLSVVSSNNSVAQKSKPLPDTPIKSKPLPATPSPKIQSQPKLKPIVLATTSDVSVIDNQITLFKDAINSEDAILVKLLVDDLNHYATGEKISDKTCRIFALHAQKSGNRQFNPKPEIKQALVQFASAWIAMKSTQGDAKGASWDVVINTLADSVQKKSKEWGMEF